MHHANPSQKKLGLRIHAIVFVLTMLVLAAINLLTGPPYWVVWIVPAWSIGLFFHGWFAVGPGASKIRS